MQLTDTQCGYWISGWGTLWLKREDFPKLLTIFPKLFFINPLSYELNRIQPFKAEMETFSRTENLWISCLSWKTGFAISKLIQTNPGSHWGHSRLCSWKHLQQFAEGIVSFTAQTCKGSTLLPHIKCLDSKGWFQL